ncbi:unnamed protein product [Linum tenue]|uniref:GAGA-binding transcriptional activator n=1 Tax=Linum tenue TaxID=586396 RepID=A0AAV0HCB8_9ROSI|nr:unnamed protein product [Linum tenue]
MDDGGHRENGRHKPDQFKAAQSQQWLMQQPTMKQIMAIMAERDAAIHERNMAISEKKAAIAERDMAFLQRDSAIAERNNALMERDSAIATLQYRDNSLPNSNSMSSSCPSNCQISRGVKHIHHPQHHLPHMHEIQGNDSPLPTSSPAIIPETAKPRRGGGKRPKDPTKAMGSNKRSSSKSKVKKESNEWKTEQDMGMGDGEDLNDKQLVVSNWKGSDLGLNQIAFDDSTMPAPVCSCTGIFRQCYKWGNGGWQSSCCTTTLSMYPLPAVPNKRHARIGGRKMSGSAFSKLLSRLAAEGHDLAHPVDLKNHWAKHGTNRYITIK